MFVRATQVGLYANVIRQPGDTFDISDDVYTADDVKTGKIQSGKDVGDVKAFSNRWMEDPEIVDTENEAARVETRKNKHQKVKTYGKTKSSDDVI